MTHLQQFHVAVPTAFDQNDELAIAPTIKHILNLRAEGVQSVLVCGSTGEQHSLNLAEKLLLVEAITENFSSLEDFTVIFGVAGLRLSELQQLLAKIEEVPIIKAILLGFPPYLLPNQEQAKNYVHTLLKYTTKQVVLYNNPRRTGFNLELETLNELLQTPKIIGLKEAGEISRVPEIIFPKEKERLIFGGGEKQVPEKIALGFTGISSIGGNIDPAAVRQCFETLVEKGQADTSRLDELNEQMGDAPLMNLKKAICQRENLAFGNARWPLNC